MFILLQLHLCPMLYESLTNWAVNVSRVSCSQAIITLLWNLYNDVRQHLSWSNGNSSQWPREQEGTSMVSQQLKWLHKRKVHGLICHAERKEPNM
uniref:Uncharacterized protein n=1 Tax=Arundo donax TaxID=35708 RepID=A0A0A9KM82_ARUDO